MFVLQKDGLRAKIVTVDNNEIDTMYIDRRNSSGATDGNTLVGCIIKNIIKTIYLYRVNHTENRCFTMLPCVYILELNYVKKVIQNICRV